MSRFESAVGQIVLLTATPSVQARSRISFSAKDIPLRYNRTRYEMLITNNRILLPDRCPIQFVRYLRRARSNYRRNITKCKSEESVLKNGEARWRDAVTHAAENIGTTEAHVIAVELKKPAK